jgi:hypothetical protein
VLQRLEVSEESLCYQHEPGRLSEFFAIARARGAPIVIVAAEPAPRVGPAWRQP